MPRVLNAAGQAVLVSDERARAGVLDGSLKLIEGEALNVEALAGGAAVTSPEELAALEATTRGDVDVVSDKELGDRSAAAFREDQYSGIGHALAAGVTGVADAATGGLFSVVNTAGDTDDAYAESLRQNEGVYDVANVAASVALARPTGLASKTLPGIAAKAAEGIVGAGKGRGLVASTGLAAAGYGVEGAMFGAGHVLAESVLHDKELTAETFLAGAQEGALWGGAAGGVGSLLTKGASAGKAAFDKAIDAKKSAAQLADDVKTAQKELKAAEKEANRARIANERHLNRVGIEELKQKGRLDLVETRAGAQKELAETRSGLKKGEVEFGTEQKLKLEEYRQGGKKELAEIGAESRLRVAQEQAQARVVAAEKKLQTEGLKADARAELEASRAKAQMELEELRQDSRLALEDMRAETRLGIADKKLEAELAKADARTAVARAKLEAVSERLAVEQERTARAGLIMEGRQQLAETYTAGWRRAAESREGVAAINRGTADVIAAERKGVATIEAAATRDMATAIDDAAGMHLRAAEVGAEARTRTGLADALARAEHPRAGTLIEEMIPAKLRTPAAVDAARGEVLNQAAMLASTTDDLVRQADEVMAMAPGASADLRFLRERAAQSSPAIASWSQKAAAGGDDFAQGFTTVRQAEQAQHDLAQAMRPYADDLGQQQLGQLAAGMDDAVAKTDDIINGAITRQAEAQASKGGALTEIAGGLSILQDAGIAGIPNVDDIPVIGPVLGAYLKFRAARGALGKLGIRVPGPVGRIAQINAQVQNRANEAVAAIVKHAPAVTKAVERSSPALAAVLAQPLWEGMDDGKPSKPAKNAKPDSPLKMYQKRSEELARLVGDPDGARRKIMDSIPAPPTVTAAIADAAIRKGQYLADARPKDPRAPTINQRPYQPGPVELQQFAEKVRACKDPIGAVSDFVAGLVGPGAIEAVKAVFPRLFLQMQTEMVEQAAEGVDAMPYDRKVRASQAFDVPLDSTLAQEYGAHRQAEYAELEAAPQSPAPSGASLQISQQHEYGAIRRSMR